jgi:hypothetical protein
MVNITPAFLYTLGSNHLPASLAVGFHTFPIFCHFIPDFADQFNAGSIGNSLATWTSDLVALFATIIPSFIFCTNFDTDISGQLVTLRACDLSTLITFKFPALGAGDSRALPGFSV